MIQISCLFTVPHTGTNFMLAFLKASNLFGKIVQVDGMVKHSMIFPPPDHPDSGLKADVRNLVWGHFMPSNMPMILPFASTCPLVVPLRDPLLGLLRKAHDQLKQEVPVDTMPILDIWLDMAVKIDLQRDVFHPFYVPLGIHWHEDERFEDMFYALTSLADLDDEETVDAQGFVSDWLRKWSKHIVENNSRGDYPLKTAYRTEDVGEIKRVLGEDYRRLTEAEHILRPMLERAGYEKLIWWS